MLDMGFEPQIRRLVQRCDMPPKEARQTFLFSATFAPEIQQLAKEFLRPYVWIAVGRVGSTTDSIEQRIVQATPDKRKKLHLVVQALQSGPKGRTLIFVQKKRSATWVKKMLQKGGPDDGEKWEMFEPIKAEDIHGDRSQSQREAALASFRAGTCRVLVATDVAARGLDIGGVEHVINMDLPTAKDDFDSYVHRIGRTGRAGHTGLATSLYVPGEDDPKAKNGKIGAALLTLLTEAEQEIPSWFAALPECRKGGGKGEKVPKVYDVRGGAAKGETQHIVEKSAKATKGGGKGGGKQGGGALPRPATAPVPAPKPKAGKGGNDGDGGGKGGGRGGGKGDGRGGGKGGGRRGGDGGGKGGGKGNNKK